MSVKIVRPDIVKQLADRDGTMCQHPECGKKIRMGITDGPFMATIDHWIPQSWAYENGWTREQVWDLSNLKLMHRKCNADKGDRLPNEDGTLPPKYKSPFRYRREKRAERAEVCTACNAGRFLDEGEVCASCGSGPMPLRMPMHRKVAPRDCDHRVRWCPMCASGIIPRPSALEMAAEQGESGEWEV